MNIKKSKSLFSILILTCGAAVIPSCFAAPTPTPTPTAAPAPNMGDAMFSGNFSDLPTNITSNSLTLRSEDRYFIYVGNVVVKQGDMTLTSKTLEGTYNEQNQIERLKAKGDVVITKVDMKATSQTATYDAATSIATLIDNPQLTQNDSILTADRIKLFLNENRSQAEGQVRVTMVKKDAAKTTITPTATPAGTQSPVAATPNAIPTPGIAPKTKK